MASDPLNFFSPFERLPPNHENQLTRALLVVLRLSPAVHAVWLRLVAPDRQLQQLPVASFATQRRMLRKASADVESADLISVFLAPEEPLSGGGIVTESDRGQVLDAIIDYGGELLVVVENKIAEAEATQALLLNTTGARVLIGGEEVVVVLWRDLLDAFIALRERGLVGGTEDTVLDDFLTYVEDHFAALGPFRTLRLCHGNEFRQSRRLRQILGEATGREASVSVYGPYIVATAGEIIGSDAYLRIGSDGGIELSLYPADTLTQARNFYTKPTAVEGLRRLCARSGWKAVPNFHFGHFERGYCWTCNQTELDHYIDIWVHRVSSEGKVARSEWQAYWAWLEEERIACADDWPEFERHFVNTNRQTASPRPGVSLSRHWSISEAEGLDERGEFVAQVGDALDDALALGELRLEDAAS